MKRVVVLPGRRLQRQHIRYTASTSPSRKRLASSLAMASAVAQFSFAQVPALSLRATTPRPRRKSAALRPTVETVTSSLLLS
jgi:hypothetical protein